MAALMRDRFRSRAERRARGLTAALNELEPRGDDADLRVPRGVATDARERGDAAVLFLTRGDAMGLIFVRGDDTGLAKSKLDPPDLGERRLGERRLLARLLDGVFNPSLGDFFLDPVRRPVGDRTSEGDLFDECLGGLDLLPDILGDVNRAREIPPRERDPVDTVSDLGAFSRSPPFVGLPLLLPPSEWRTLGLSFCLPLGEPLPSAFGLDDDLGML